MGLPEGMTAQVVANEPCPPIDQGPGRVVLTTVNHLNPRVVELTLQVGTGRRTVPDPTVGSLSTHHPNQQADPLAKQACSNGQPLHEQATNGSEPPHRSGSSNKETVRPTAFHKFYSESRQAWLSAEDLQPGETLRGLSGPLQVVSQRPVPGTHRVYNMTVEGEHVYHVSTLGVLAHNNACGSKVLRAVTPEQAEAIRAGKGITKPKPAHRTTPTQHVAGTKHSRDPWTSTTLREESAEFFATHGGTRPANPVVEIDLSYIAPENILDVSTQAKAARHLKTPFTHGGRAANQYELPLGCLWPAPVGRDSLSKI